MSFTPPDHTLYPWQDGRDPSITAQHLGAAEQGVVDHTDASIVALSDSIETEISAFTSLSPDVVWNIISRVGSLSGTYTLDMSGANLTLAGVVAMIGDVTVAPVGFSDGSRAEMTFSDGGGFALSVLVDAQSIPVAIPASGPFILRLSTMDGSVFIQVAAALSTTATQSVAWVGTIAPLVNNQLDASRWPYQSVASGHLAVVTDPLGLQGTVLTMSITETG